MKIPPPFSVTNTSPIPETRCLKITGELDLATLPTLQAQVEKHQQDLRGANVVVDLGECDFIDSAAIAYIVDLWRQTENGGEGCFALCGLSAPVRRTFEITGLTDRLHISPDCAGALAHLQTASGSQPPA